MRRSRWPDCVWALDLLFSAGAVETRSAGQNLRVLSTAGRLTLTQAGKRQLDDAWVPCHSMSASHRAPDSVMCSPSRPAIMRSSGADVKADARSRYSVASRISSASSRLRSARG